MPSSNGGIASDEEQGVYHPEDDDPVAGTPSPEENAVLAENETASEYAEPDEDTPSTSAVPREALEPSDTFSGATMSNQAPVGTEDNPIVQYSRR